LTKHTKIIKNHQDVSDFYISISLTSPQKKLTVTVAIAAPRHGTFQESVAPRRGRNRNP
jgi:hypothetical protein